MLVDAFPDEGARTAGFPRGVEYRKHWEVAMALRAFRDLGVLHPDARILGVGAGTERTVFHLSRHVAEVVATDVYLGTGASEGEAQLLMLFSPWSCTRADFDPARLTVRHMDGRVLDFPDGSFDGVVSPSSIQRFGTDEEIAAVLRARGVPVISTTGGALPEVVGEAGVLVPPADPPALAAAIRHLLDHPHYGRELGRRGLQRGMLAAQFLRQLVDEGWAQPNDVRGGSRG